MNSMGKRKTIKIKRLGPEGHTTWSASISEATEVLSAAITNEKFVYVEPQNHIIYDVGKLRAELSQIESAIIIPKVAGG